MSASPRHATTTSSTLDTGATATLGTIWGAVALISLFSPDLVSGSEQQHLPVAAFTTWIWGAVATRPVLAALVRPRSFAGDEPVRIQLAVFVAAIWFVAAAVSIFAPPVVTGSDPTSVPVAALIAPAVAAFLTVTGYQLVVATTAEGD